MGLQHFNSTVAGLDPSPPGVNDHREVPKIERVIPADRDRPGRQVAPEIAGDELVPLDLLKRRVGKTAFAVWWEMLCCRSQGGGLFHGTIARLAQRLDKGERAVGHALKRLRDAGLVLDGGWVKLEVYTGRRVAVRKVYTRTVYGAIVADDTASIPRRAALRLGGMQGHGGARKGAGFKTVASGAREPASRRRHEDVHPSPAVVDHTVHTDQFKTVGGEGGAPVQDGSPIENSKRVDTLSGVAFGNVAPSEPALQTFGSLPRSKGDKARTLGTPRHAPPPITLGGSIPPFPATSLIKPAQKPAPPRLTADMGDHALARTLVDTWNACVSNRFNVRSMSLASDKSLTNAPFYRNLIKAGQTLRDKKIAPAAWVAFWMDDRIDKGYTKPIPIKIVFGANFVADQKKRWVFRKNRPHHGGRVEFGPAHRALIDRYEDMRFAIRSRGVSTLQEVEAIVSEFFPPGQWGLMLEAAQNEAKARQVHYDHALQNGEFLW